MALQGTGGVAARTLFMALAWGGRSLDHGPELLTARILVQSPASLWKMLPRRLDSEHAQSLTGKQGWTKKVKCDDSVPLLSPWQQTPAISTPDSRSWWWLLPRPLTDPVTSSRQWKTFGSIPPLFLLIVSLASLFWIIPGLIPHFLSLLCAISPDSSPERLSKHKDSYTHVWPCS